MGAQQSAARDGNAFLSSEGAPIRTNKTQASDPDTEPKTGPTAFGTSAGVAPALPALRKRNNQEERHNNKPHSRFGAPTSIPKETQKVEAKDVPPQGLFSPSAGRPFRFRTPCPPSTNPTPIVITAPRQSTDTKPIIVTAPVGTKPQAEMTQPVDPDFGIPTFMPDFLEIQSSALKHFPTLAMAFKSLDHHTKVARNCVEKKDDDGEVYNLLACSRAIAVIMKETEMNRTPIPKGTIFDRWEAHWKLKYEDCEKLLKARA
ncbi:hypothetical protein BJ508DRAFT_311370 [Ascobolus immersus RN42]|uniref:Uncharacterized protein n=1 Tax=Ascobolus immersus RN42 TaxID=1160509 RepID=A0A3N4HQQ0_ASCIM|nr:hypothetical protein BJ508DRAFT_311370 [Ascobolus immersus RN42]